VVDDLRETTAEIPNDTSQGGTQQDHEDGLSSLTLGDIAEALQESGQLDFAHARNWQYFRWGAGLSAGFVVGVVLLIVILQMRGA
jgi:hypothetical protein